MIKNKILHIAISICVGVYVAYLASLVPNTKVDPEFSNYFSYIRSTIKTNCKKYDFPAQYSIEFSNLYDDVIGLCSKSLFRWNIKIDPKAWASLNEPQKLALLAHEVFHCSLEVGHNEDKLNIMNSFLPYYSNMEQVMTEISKVIEGCK